MSFFLRCFLVCVTGIISLLAYAPTVRAEAAPNAFGIDSRCFVMQQCLDFRRNMLAKFDMGASRERPEDGFYTGPDAISVCGQTLSADGQTPEQMGFCTPVGASVTAVKIAGRDRFSNVAEFIKYVYRYGIIVGIVLAVVMIIIAGIQWLTSAGGSDGINSAKKKITGSVVGLVLLSTSYAILVTINPALVQLRLPQVWMINPIDLAPTVCSALDEAKLIAEALPPLPPGSSSPRSADDRQTAINSRFTAVSSDASQFNKHKAQAMCGGEYFVQGAGPLTCRGDACGARQVCFALQTVPTCTRGSIFGRITNSSWVNTLTGDLVGDWDWEEGVAGISQHGWIYTDMGIYGVCEDGERIDLEEEYIIDPTDNTSINLEQKTQVYGILLNETHESLVQKGQQCTSDGFQGFVVQASWVGNWNLNVFNYEDHVYGKTGEIAVDLGDCDTAFLLGFVTPACKSTLKNVSANMLISEEDLLKGFILNFDLASTPKIGIDGDNVNRTQAYSRYGYRTE